MENTAAPDDYPLHYASLLHSAGNALASAGDHAGGRQYLKKALALQQPLHVAESPWLMQTRLSLALCEEKLGNLLAARAQVVAVEAALRDHPLHLGGIRQRLAEQDARLAGR